MSTKSTNPTWAGDDYRWVYPRPLSPLQIQMFVWITRRAIRTTENHLHSLKFTNSHKIFHFSIAFFLYYVRAYHHVIQVEEIYELPKSFPNIQLSCSAKCCAPYDQIICILFFYTKRWSMVYCYYLKCQISTRISTLFPKTLTLYIRHWSEIAAIF